MDVYMAGRTIVSPKIVLLILMVAAFGYGVVHVVANRKWGYTPKREKDLEDAEKGKNDSCYWERNER